VSENEGEAAPESGGLAAESARWNAMALQGLGFSPASGIGVHHRLMVWGASGAGKTVCAVRAAADLDVDIAAGGTPVGDRRCAVLTFERNAIPSIRAANPLASIKLAQTKDEAIQILQAAQAGRLTSAGFTWLVIDGLTELQRLIGDTLVKDSDGYWNQLIDRTRLMLRMIRSIPMSVVATALEQSRENEQTKVVSVSPQFEGRNTPDAAMETYSAVGRATREGEGDLSRYVVDFNLASRYRVKPCAELRNRVKPCAAAWMDVLDGKLPYDAIRIARTDRVAATLEPAAASDTTSTAAEAKTRGARR
jgi:hypothetical protein